MSGPYDSLRNPIALLLKVLFSRITFSELLAFVGATLSEWASIPTGESVIVLRSGRGRGRRTAARGRAWPAR